MSGAPQWVPTISLGNVLTILALALGGTATWIQYEHRITVLEQQQIAAADLQAKTFETFSAAINEGRQDRQDLREKYRDLDWRTRSLREVIPR